MVRRKWRLFVRKVCAWLACTNKNPLPSFLLVLFLGGVVWLFVDISSRHWQQDREIHISEAIRNYGFLVGAGLGLGVAVWRSVVAAKTLKHSQETQREDSLYKTRSLNTDRFQRASAMLAEKKRTVRVAGIFVLRDLAAQHPEDYHNTVMSLLCLYLREQQKKDTKASTGAEDSGKQAAAENTSEENQEAKKEAGWRGELPLDALEIIRIISGRENRDKETDGLIDLHGCDFCGYHFPFKTDLSGVNLHASNLSGVHLFRANLSGAHLWDANLSGAELLGANLSGAELLGANLSGADLGNANLSGAELGNANLSGADLFRANLSGAHLFRANLSGAHLQGASFSGAHLLDANFSGAYLENANFHDTQIYKTVFWNEERGGANTTNPATAGCDVGVCG